MLRGIYAAHADCVKCTADDLRCYCIAKKHPGKVAIINRRRHGASSPVPGLCGRGHARRPAAWAACSSPRRPSRFSTSPRKWKMAPACSICTATTRRYHELRHGRGDVRTGGHRNALHRRRGRCALLRLGGYRRGVAGIFFFTSAPAPPPAQLKSLDEVLAVAQKAKDRTRTVGFALTPCVIPEVGKPNFTPSKRVKWPWAWASMANPACGNGPIQDCGRVGGGIRRRDPQGHARRRGRGSPPCSSTAWARPSQEELYILPEAFPGSWKRRREDLPHVRGPSTQLPWKWPARPSASCSWTTNSRPLLDAPAHTPFYTQM